MSTAGLKILHQIDAAITKARANSAQAAVLPMRAGAALLELHEQQKKALEQIAQDRLTLLGAEGGPENVRDLGYVDRQSEKLLKQHSDVVSKSGKALERSEAALKSLEARRRKDEALVAKAVDAYDKSAAKAEAALLKSPDYLFRLEDIESQEATVVRANEKLGLAREDEIKKGAPYRSDPFFSYLQKRGYGTGEAKGWFLTRWLDGGVARLCGYRQAAENYRRLTAIPARIENHVERLETQAERAQQALQTFEADWLTAQGVSEKHKASLTAQNTLEATDAKITAAEAEHQQQLSAHTALITGESGPYKDALDLMTQTLSRTDSQQLRRLAAQTQTRKDDQAVSTLRELSETKADLLADQKEAQTLLTKYQTSLSDLQSVRQNFKARRFDSPSSSFSKSNLILALLTQVLAGGRTGADLWSQIKRSQRTSKRYSDTDFGGIDWTEGLRLPRSTRGSRGGSIDLGDIFGSGGFGGGGFGGRRGGYGGGYPSRRRSRTRRTSLPRRPRQSLPKRSRSGGGGFSRGGRSRGGFKTGGGF